MPLDGRYFLTVALKSFTVGRFRSRNFQDECNITYFNYREELSFEDGLTFKAQLTCDSNLTESIVSKRSSSGLLSRGQNSVESTGHNLHQISDYVRNAVKLCDARHKYKPAQQKEPLIPHDNNLAKGILNRKTSLMPRLKS